MQLTRRRFLTGLTAGAATLWLGACGGPGATPTRPTAGGPTSTPSTTTTAGAGRTTATRTTGGTAGSTAPAVSGPPVRVRVGYIPILVFSPLYIAIEKGYFREQGIEPALTPLAGGTDALTQTAGGNLEVGLGGLGAAAFNAIQRGLDFRIVSSQHSESPPLATPLVVAKRRYDDGTYRRVADLRGKKVSINAPGTGTEYWLQAALAKGGLTIREITLTPLAFDQVAAALESGALDGGMLGEPLVTLAEGRGLVQRLADDFLTDAQGTVIFYNQTWARGQQALADRWLAAWLRGARDLQGGGYGRDENAAIIERYTKVPKDVVKAAKPPLHDPNGRLNLDDMRAQQQYFLTTGALTYSTPIDLTTIVDTGYAERAVRLLGG